MKNLFLTCLLLFATIFFLSGCGGGPDMGFSNRETDVDELSSDKLVKEEKENKRILITLAFPDKDKNLKGKEPFFLCFKLPGTWSAEVESLANNEESITPCYYIFDEKENRIGSVSYNSYYINSALEKETPLNIYKDLSMLRKTYFDIENTFQIVNSTYEGDTALVDIVYKKQKNEEKEDVNYGILSYNRRLSSYIVMELSSLFVTEDEALEVAKSISFK